MPLNSVVGEAESSGRGRQKRCGASARLATEEWETGLPGDTELLGVVTAVSTAPVELEQPGTSEDVRLDPPWITIVWNDPINLMSYVTYVFQKVFGYSKPIAEKLMLDVHHKGKAVVSSGAREAMERDAQALHGYGLWATVSHNT